MAMTAEEKAIEKKFILVAIALFAFLVVYIEWSGYKWEHAPAPQHLAEMKAALSLNRFDTARLELSAIADSAPEHIEGEAILAAADKAAREKKARNFYGQAHDPFSCGKGEKGPVVSYDNGGHWWVDDGRCANQLIQKQKDKDAKLHSYYSTKLRVDTDMNSSWLPDEERTCETYPDLEGKVSTVTCEPNNHDTHNIPVTFWGGVTRNTASQWKCRRESDFFVCRALN